MARIVLKISGEYLREVFSLNEMVIPKTLKIFEFKEPEHTFQNLELLPFGSDTSCCPVVLAKIYDNR